MIKSSLKTFTVLWIFFLSTIGVQGDASAKPLVDVLKEPAEPGQDTPDTLSDALEGRSANLAEIITGNADCACGRQSIHPRIVGGELAKINDLPWTVAIVDKMSGGAFCGATLICDRYVLTAAHCMTYVYGPEQIQVYLMEEDFEVENENAQPTLKIDIEKIIIHPDWDSRKLNNDMTLLKLATPVSMNQDSKDPVTPACVPSNNAVSFTGQEAIVAGWGATAYGRQGVSKLRKVKVPIFSNEECRSTRYKNGITQNMLCAGFLEGQKDSCQGDSGGPLVVQQGVQFLLVGVVSFGYECAQPNAPGVYARVGRYGDWIRENTKECQYCKR